MYIFGLSCFLGMYNRLLIMAIKLLIINILDFKRTYLIIVYEV